MFLTAPLTVTLPPTLPYSTHLLSSPSTSLLPAQQCCSSLVSHSVLNGLHLSLSTTLSAVRQSVLEGSRVQPTHNANNNNNRPVTGTHSPDQFDTGRNLFTSIHSSLNNRHNSIATQHSTTQHQQPLAIAQSPSSSSMSSAADVILHRSSGIDSHSVQQELTEAEEELSGREVVAPALEQDEMETVSGVDEEMEEEIEDAAAAEFYSTAAADDIADSNAQSWLNAAALSEFGLSESDALQAIEAEEAAEAIRLVQEMEERERQEQLQQQQQH